MPTIKASKDFGLFGGILGKLPPELQRAGDALQTVKRSLPIGRITGGRLFPPFELIYNKGDKLWHCLY